MPSPVTAEPVVVLQRGAMALAQVAQATQPACVHELGEVYQHHRPLLPVDQDTTPAALSPLRRQNPREERWSRKCPWNRPLLHDGASIVRPRTQAVVGTALWAIGPGRGRRGAGGGAEAA